MIVSKWSIKLFIWWNSRHQLLLKIIKSIDVIYLDESCMDLLTDFYWKVRWTGQDVRLGQMGTIMSVDPIPESIKTHMFVDQAQSMTKQM